MARYVLVEFDRDDEADAFVSTIGRVGDAFASPGTMRVVGLYMKPTQFCECPNPGDKSVRGQKYGLWIHKGCGKPKRGHWQSGKNLLNPDETPAKRKLMISLVEPRQPLPLAK